MFSYLQFSRKDISFCYFNETGILGLQAYK